MEVCYKPLHSQLPIVCRGEYHMCPNKLGYKMRQSKTTSYLEIVSAASVILRQWKRVLWRRTLRCCPTTMRQRLERKWVWEVFNLNVLLDFVSVPNLLTHQHQPCSFTIPLDVSVILHASGRIINIYVILYVWVIIYHSSAVNVE